MANLLFEIEQAYLGNENKIALVVGHKRYSYAELMEKVNSVAYAFYQQGLRPEQKLAMVLPNCAEAVILILAAARINITLVPLPLSVTSHSFFTAYESTQFSSVCVWHGKLNELKPVMDEKHIELAWFNVNLDSITNVHSQQSCFNHAHTKVAEIDISYDPLAPYILTMTSGSTGAPKPIVLSQHTKLCRAQSAIALYGVSDNDVTLIATPLYHSLAERLLFVSLLSGGTAILLERFTTDTWLDAIAQHRVTFSIAVSSQLKQLLNNETVKHTDLTSLRCLVSSSALLDHKVKINLLKLLACQFHECYGASEVAIVSNVKFEASEPNMSVGKAIPGVEITILDDNNMPCKVGTIGEIACKSDYEFSGYYQQPNKTQDAYWNDYFKTGDLGYLDEQQNLYFVGRQKDIIITGGINVYPSDIESQVKKHKWVNDAVAFSLPDEYFGECVGLAIELRNGIEFGCSNSTSPVVTEIRLQCAEHLENAQQPRQLFVVERLPQNAMGKLDRLKMAATAQKLLQQCESRRPFYLVRCADFEQQ